MNAWLTLVGNILILAICVLAGFTWGQHSGYSRGHRVGQLQGYERGRQDQLTWNRKHINDPGNEEKL